MFSVITFTVTGTFLDGVALSPPSATVLVEIGRSDREVIFLNQVEYTPN